MRRDTRVAFFDVGLTDGIKSPPFGTEHRWAPGQEKWQSTPGYHEPVLGPHVTKKEAAKLVERMLEHHKGPAFYFLVAFEEQEKVVQLAFLKTESGADDLLQFSNCRPPMWWTHPKPPPPPPKPDRFQTLMGDDLF